MILTLPPAQTIDEVILQLDAVIKHSLSRNSADALFAFVYQHTTIAIKNGIINCEFEDNQRMENFDVQFANYYLDAYKKFYSGKNISECWKVAFQECRNSHLIIQYVMLGMNAHIQFDLAVTTAVVSKGKDIKAIEKDFHRVNDILKSIINELQEKMSKVSVLMFLFDWVGQNSDEKIIDYSMRLSRSQSWEFANLFWSLPDNLQVDAINDWDIKVATIASAFANPPGFFLSKLKWLIRSFEEKDVHTILQNWKIK